MNRQNPIIYRLSQFFSLLLGARFFVLIFYVFTLYVSTFFLFNREEGLGQFVFDYKIHGIILCSLLSLAAGGIINQFYDLEKDKIQRPFRTRIQGFLRQKYFLYSYIILNIISLSIASILSSRILIFFLVYQFFIWFYSHKLSKVLVVNNLSYVSLSMYPFFGMLVYYRHFSEKLFLMAIFLFLLILIIDILKDILTLRPDKIFGYQTIPTVFGIRNSGIVIGLLMVLNILVSLGVVGEIAEFNYLKLYFYLSFFVQILALVPVFHFKFKNVHRLMNFLRLWIFCGVAFMLLNGIYEKF